MLDKPFLCLLCILFLSKLVLSQSPTQTQASQNIPNTSPNVNLNQLALNVNTSDLNSLLDPRIYSLLIKNKTYPNTHCMYISTPRPEDNITVNGQSIHWECPAGYFCLGPNNTNIINNNSTNSNTSSMVKCPPGFFCPENSAQPIYCCEGYYCSRDAKNITMCPADYVCSIGTVDPVFCDRLAICPPGSSKANKFLVFVLVFFIAIVIIVLFQIKKKRDQLKNVKYDRLLTEQKLRLERTLDPVKKTFDIEFENLGLVLPSGIEIMKGVSGKLTHGRACAIMGPSGAGKTTFVSLLTGKAKRTSGAVKINGVPDSLEKYRKLIGFVPQEDVMLRELTVRDILVHSALMRLPSDMDRKLKKQKVIEVIEFLELSHVMESIIGNEEQRGVSGGQRKRVNIGMELVAEPSVLFLDEPTSGLDSATALEVCNLLKKIAHSQGMTVAAVIHSPSPQAFNTFDDFLLLGKGGRIVYFGPTNKAMDYFESLGYRCPEDESPADFMMEVAAGKVKPVDKEDITVLDLFEAWEKYRESGKASFNNTKIGIPGDESESASRNCFKAFWVEFCLPFFHVIQDVAEYISDVTIELFLFLQRSLCFCQRDPIRETPNVVIAFLLLFKRACLQLYRNRTQFLLDQLLHLGCGIFISLAVSNLDYIGKAPDQICQITPYVLMPICFRAKDSIQNVGVFMALGVTFAGISAGGSTFGYEKVVYWRDTSAGMRTVPYFLAKLVADIPRLLIAALMFTLAFIIFYSFKARIWQIYIIILLTYVAAWAMGYFISAVASKEKLSLVGTGFALGWGMVLSGATPKLEDVESGGTFTYIGWLWDVSAPRWAVEALYLKELEPRLWDEIKKEPLAHTYSFNDYPQCLWNILLIAFGWAVLAFFAMKLTNRDKHK
ncbi:putative ATP-dependent permease ADP1 [Gigaspora margarita]|uniref:Putative ATP-dependent permease ADP1 n=1 Tax=Gigaspora margarita TaxID=4874 RepID=A0A8H3XCI8_GIGMA|nr:putative ATP-dependent permease ADP1 [Gigaspora margarita]